jgi:spore germination protein (amino acid permease)
MTVANPQSKSKIGSRELTAILVLMTTTDIFLNYANGMTRQADEAAWMEPLLAGSLCLLVFLLAEWLLRRYLPGQDIVEAGITAFGHVGGVLVTLIFSAYFLFVTAMVMREFEETVITTVLPTTPIVVVGVLFVLTVWYVAYNGLEAIARLSYLGLFVLIAGILILSLLTANWWHPNLLFPLLGRGPTAVLRGILPASTAFFNVLILVTIYTYTYNPASLRRVGVTSILISVFLMCVFLLAYEMVFSIPQAQEATSPLYTLARQIRLGRFLQRFESIFIFMWVMAAVLKMSMTLWLSSFLLAKAFGWPLLRPILPAMAMASWAISLLPADLASVLNVSDRVRSDWGWAVIFVLPLLVLSVAAWRTRRRRKGGVQGA